MLRKFFKYILFISTCVILCLSTNVSACTSEDGCANCSSSIAETECKKNIKIAIFGDSISTYEGYINGIDGNSSNMSYYPTQNISVNETWWKRLANSKGWTVLSNDSISSTRVTWDGTTNDNERIGEKYYMAGRYRINSIGSKGIPNKIFIFAGVNDIYASDVPIGSVNTASTVNDSIFANAYNSMLKKIRTKYPNTDIICIAPYIPIYKKSDTITRTNQIDSIIIQLAKNNGLKYVDLRTISFINEDFIDGIHPSSSGMLKIANAISNSVNTSSTSSNISNETSSETNPSKTPGSQTENITMTSEDKSDLNCDSLFGTNTAVGKYIHDIYNIIKFIVPLLLLALSIKDFGGGILSQNDNAVKVALNKFWKRLIIAVVILVLPTILNFILEALGINTCFL